jgi:hypothetical protein
MAIPVIGQVNMTTLPSFLNLARTNLYQVYITPQWGTKGNTTEQEFLKHLKKGSSRYGIINFENDFSNTLGLLCSEATIPTSSYATSEVKDNFMGVSQEFAHTRINTDIDFTFYIDREYKVLGFFEAWMDFISGGSDVAITDANALYSGNYYRRFNYPNYYKNKSGIYIKKFEKDWQTSNAPNISFQLINAFPKSVSSLSVSYGESEVLKVTVTMNYDRYIARREYADVTSDQRTFQQSIDPSTSKGNIPGTTTVGQSGAGTFQDLNRINRILGQA